MPAAEFPFQMFGCVPVLRTPAEIDITTSGELRAALLRCSRGHATVVVDLTGTVFCDLAGLRELRRAHQRAVADGGGLRLVTPAEGTFARIFTLTGMDGIIPHFASVEEALAQLPPADGPLQEPRRRPAAAPASRPGQTRPRPTSPVGDTRRCEQCGAVFLPAREHARFCTSDCRAAWNREHLGDPVVEASALIWSIAAMSDATARLPAMRAWDKTQALAAIGEAVWWITMVDATLVRHHPRAYIAAQAAHSPVERWLIKETLGGLRFVRNWLSREAGLADVVETGPARRRITLWTWSPVPEPALAWLPPRAQAWERARWQAYQACLARDTIGRTFGRAVTFLTLAGADAASSRDASEYATRGRPQPPDAGSSRADKRPAG